MTRTSIPKYLSGLVSNLQADAWTRNLRLVTDATSPIQIDLKGADLESCLKELLGALLPLVPPLGSISLVTGFEPAGDSQVLKLNLGAPVSDQSALAPAVAALKALARRLGGDVVIGPETRVFSLELTLPGATLETGVPKARTILVVDDDTDTQKFLTAVLEPEGYRVIQVSDGFDALIAVERHDPDLILTDILMPNMNGTDLIARIRQSRENLPIIAFSGFRDVLINNISGLPDKILSKPMGREQVLAAVREVLVQAS